MIRYCGDRMKKSEMNDQYIMRKNIIVIVTVVLLLGIFIFYFIRFGTFASDNPFVRRTLFSTLKLDEEAYGDTSFDSTDLEFRTILDKDLENSLGNSIYISFWVGGNKENDAEDAVYDIALQDLVVDCDLLSPYVKWLLKKNGEELSFGSLDYHFDTIVNGRFVLTPIQQDLVSYNEDKSKYDYYEFYLWLSDSCQEDNLSDCKGSVSQNSLLGKKISGKVEVELYTKTKRELVRKPADVLDTNSCIHS